MNKFRSQQLEERRDFVKAEIYRSEMKALETKLEALIHVTAVRVNELEKHKDNMDGRYWMLGAVLTAITVGLNLLFKFWGK